MLFRSDRLLRPGGLMLLQTITVDDQWFPRYHGAPDWIEKYIFPGGELASIGEVLQSLARVTSLSVHHAENIGMHYALTLRAWRQRFHARLAEVRAQGFSGCIPGRIVRRMGNEASRKDARADQEQKSRQQIEPPIGRWPENVHGGAIRSAQ